MSPTTPVWAFLALVFVGACMALIIAGALAAEAEAVRPPQGYDSRVAETSDEDPREERQ